MSAAPLTDAFGRRHSALRVSLEERCNLRCRYCMPAEGVALAPRDALLTTDELVRLVALLVGAGVEKVRLTGGEPLVRSDVERVADRIGALAGLRALGLTTNGLLLPGKLDGLRRAGLTHLNVSLDTLREDRFRRLARRPGLGRVLGAVEAALAAGYAAGTERPLKLNCVVMRGVNDDEAAGFVALTEAWPVEVRFIEFMPFSGNGWGRGRLVPMAETRARVEEEFELVPLDDGPHSTARTFAVPGHAGRVGFIASMSAPFCAGCNRLRLTADGALKVCLFGRAEVSLRDLLRAGASDADVLAAVGAAVRRKAAAHAGADALADAAASEPDRPMILIGG